MKLKTEWIGYTDEDSALSFNFVWSAGHTTQRNQEVEQRIRQRATALGISVREMVERLNDAVVEPPNHTFRTHPFRSPELTEYIAEIFGIVETNDDGIIR